MLPACSPRPLSPVQPREPQPIAKRHQPAPPPTGRMLIRTLIRPRPRFSHNAAQGDHTGDHPPPTSTTAPRPRRPSRCSRPAAQAAGPEPPPRPRRRQPDDTEDAHPPTPRPSRRPLAPPTAPSDVKRTSTTSLDIRCSSFHTRPAPTGAHRVRTAPRRPAVTHGVAVGYGGRGAAAADPGGPAGPAAMHAPAGIPAVSHDVAVLTVSPCGVARSSGVGRWPRCVRKYTVCTKVHRFGHGANVRGRGVRCGLQVSRGVYTRVERSCQLFGTVCTVVHR